VFNYQSYNLIKQLSIFDALRFLKKMCIKYCFRIQKSKNMEKSKPKKEGENQKLKGGGRTKDLVFMRNY
jgi:hypothetical protein